MVSNFLHPQNLLACYISIHLSLLKIDTHLSYFSTTDMSVILSRWTNCLILNYYDLNFAKLRIFSHILYIRSNG